MNDVHLREYEKIREKAVKTFILENELIDEKALLLQTRFILGAPTPLVADQIAGRRKAKIKLPLYYSTQDIIYPKGLNLEQSSSETTACLKAGLLALELETTSSIIDLTGGFGVDSFFFSRYFDSLDFVEKEAELILLAESNHRSLKAAGINYHLARADNYLKLTNSQVDAVYIDPSRRVKQQKVFRLADCEPNVLELQEEIFKRTDLLLIKGSPLMDITQATLDLLGLSKVFVLSVDHECRELLFLCRKGFSGEPLISALHMSRNEMETFQFFPSDERACEVRPGPAEKYLYEPNPSIIKAGAFKLIGDHFHLTKLHPNTHLYTGPDLIPDFPGRIFEITAKLRNNRIEIKAAIPQMKVNITTRNYPLGVHELKKKLNLQDGGSQYLIATTSVDGKILLLSNRLK